MPMGFIYISVIEYGHMAITFVHKNDYFIFDVKNDSFIFASKNDSHMAFCYIHVV